MSYAAGEAQILTLIRGMAGNVWGANNSFSLSNDSTRNTDAILNSGADYHYLILSPGAFKRDFMTVGDTDIVNVWRTQIALYVVDDPQAGPVYQLNQDREAVMAQLDKYGRLNGTPSGVFRSLVVEGEPIKLLTTGNDIAFQSTRMVIEWHEDQTVTQVD